MTNHFVRAWPSHCALDSEIDSIVGRTEFVIIQTADFKKLIAFHPCLHPRNLIGRSEMKRFTGKTATAIIPFPEDNILLVKRNTVPFKGYWALPGGRMDPGENIKQTVIREVKEETGLNIEVIRVIGEYVEKGVKDEVEYEYYPTCFLVKVIGGKIKRQEGEIQEIRLFSLKKLPNPLAFEHDKIIKDYLSKAET